MIKKLFALAICSTLLFSTAFINTACKGTPKTIAYKTLKSAGDAVDYAMKAFAEATVAGAIDQPTQDKVRELHGKFRLAFAKAVTAAHFDYETGSPAEVAGLAAELTGLIATYVQRQH